MAECLVLYLKFLNVKHYEKKTTPPLPGYATNETVRPTRKRTYFITLIAFNQSLKTKLGLIVQHRSRNV